MSALMKTVLISAVTAIVITALNNYGILPPPLRPRTV